MAPGIRLQRTLSRATIGASNEPQLLYVFLEATLEGMPAEAPKLPLNLSLLIDRSSSMRGDRLNQVKDAACQIVDLLGDQDYFSLVVFNDRAEVVVPAQRAINKVALKQSINRVEAAGGTEMATGMALAVQEIQRPMMMRGISRILLLTDGRTYGDESRCVEIARRAQGRNIGLTAMGIGTEWNEDLLETMTAHENSHAQYITSAQQVRAVFTDELKRMSSVFAQRVRLAIAARPGATIRSLDQVRPYISPVTIAEESSQQWVGVLGDWNGNDSQQFLIEVVVPPLEIGNQPLLKLSLMYDLVATNQRDLRSDEVVRVQVADVSEVGYQVDPMVKHWLERLVAYRLQLNAWKDVEAGRVKEATQRLKMASTRLFDAGESSLARTVEREATRLLNSGETSEEGRKRIRFGTRGLMGQTTPREQETGA